MEGTKFVKARCKRTGKYYGLEVLEEGGCWVVVNVDELTDDKAQKLASEVRQDEFYTNENLLACTGCNSRRIGGCSCAKRKYDCKPDMDYHLDCAYCKDFEIDYSIPRGAHDEDEYVEIQGKLVKVVTFSNVEWQKFDRLNYHEDGRAAGYAEPTEHVIATEDRIEFHGYNISAMNEGVYYVIGEQDDFDIECTVDTSGIMPHPGGCFYIDFGLIKAEITEKGGTFYLGGRSVKTVGTNFRMRLSLTDAGTYTIYINGKEIDSEVNRHQSKTEVIFGFRHDAHHCSNLSHAILSGIVMHQGIARTDAPQKPKKRWSLFG